MPIGGALFNSVVSTSSGASFRTNNNKSLCFYLTFTLEGAMQNVGVAGGGKAESARVCVASSAKYIIALR